MIQKLEVKDYHKIYSLLKTDMEINSMLINAVISGTNKGSIYVDNIHDPRTAIIYGVGISYTFVGDFNNHLFMTNLKDHIDHVLKYESLELCNGTWFLATVFNNLWEQSLDKVLSSRDYGKFFEYHYEFNQNKFTTTSRISRNLPDGYFIKKIDQRIILEDEENLLEGILEYWNTIDAFCEEGIGYVICKAEKIVSACYSCFVHENRHEMVVETFTTNEQNKGLGTIVTQTYIHDCLQNNKTPCWSTDNTNIASQKLAERLGFEYKYKLRLYEFEF